MAVTKAGRRRSGPWPWITGLIVAALLLWVAADAMVGRPPETPADERAVPGTASDPAQAEPAPLQWPVAATVLEAGHSAAAA